MKAAVSTIAFVLFFAATVSLSGCDIVNFPDIPYAAAEVTVTNVDPNTRHIRVGTKDSMAENLTNNSSKCYPLFDSSNGEPTKQFNFLLLKSGKHKFRAETYSDSSGTQRLQYGSVDIDLDKEETAQLTIEMKADPSSTPGDFFTECMEIINNLSEEDIKKYLDDQGVGEGDLNF